MRTSCPPRLAIITSQAFSLYNFRGPLIRALVQRGIEVVALAPDWNDSSRSAVRALGALPVEYRMSRAGLNPFRDAVDVVALMRVLRREKPDMTLSYFIKPVIYGTLAAAAAGVPSRFALVPGLGYAFATDAAAQTLPRRAMRSVVTRLYAAAFARCDRVIFQNADDPELFVSQGLLAPGKVVRTNGTGVDLSSWIPAPFPDTPLAFCLIARLLREKGIVEYVEAARRVRERHPECRFFLVGGVDPNPSALSRDEIQSWVASGAIEWAGQADEVRPWIARAHVYILPSYYREGVPRSTQEAMAMGRAVITADTVGCRETVIDGVNGFLVPPRDVTALITAIERFIRQPELVTRMGRESRRIAEERFDVHRTNATILSALGFE